MRRKPSDSRGPTRRSGPLDANRSTNALIVGSGYFPPIEDSIPNRGASRATRRQRLVSHRCRYRNLGGQHVRQFVPADRGRDRARTRAASRSAMSPPTAGRTRSRRTRRRPAIRAISSSRKLTSETATADIGASISIRCWHHFREPDGRHRRAYLRIVCAVGSRQLPTCICSSRPAVTFSRRASPGGTGTFRLYGLKDNGSSALTKFAQDLATVSAGTGCTATGERASTAPSVAGDIVFLYDND